MGFSPVFVISPGGTREKSEISKSILGFPLGFPETFMKNRDFRGFWGPGGVPVIKEGKAIALRTIDMFFCLCICAMQWTQVLYAEVPVFHGKWGPKGGQNRVILGSKSGHLWAVRA